VNTKDCATPKTQGALVGVETNKQSINQSIRSIKSIKQPTNQTNNQSINQSKKTNKQTNKQVNKQTNQQINKKKRTTKEQRRYQHFCDLLLVFRRYQLVHCEAYRSERPLADELEQRSKLHGRCEPGM
jgi:hypothetical protein